MDDWKLLNDYATKNSQEAFRALVERYAGMLYHAALRQTGNPPPLGQRIRRPSGGTEPWILLSLR